MAARVLIIDDDAAFRAKVGVLLASRGHLVAGEAGSVAEAREAVADLRPNAVLLDVNLPDGNGLDLARELSANGAGLRILITSSDASAAPPSAVRSSGATGFVSKTDLAITDLARYLDA
jgi:DNA-binding NarL/FixJ family response regulator